MNKQDGWFRGQVGVTPNQGSKLVDRGLMLTPLPGNRVPFNRTANRDVQTSASYFKCEAALLQKKKKKITGGSLIFFFFFSFFTSWRYASFFLDDRLRCLSSVE